MNMKTKITLIVLCVFIAGIAVTAVAGPREGQYLSDTHIKRT